MNQKEEAIEIMKELKLSETIIQQFEENGMLYRSEIVAYIVTVMLYHSPSIHDMDNI